MNTDEPTTINEALAQTVRNRAEDEARSRLWDALYGKTPHFLHPLIPGSKRTFQGDMEERARRRVKRAVGGCVFSLVFVAVVVGVLVAVAMMVGWAMMA